MRGPACGSVAAGEPAFRPACLVPAEHTLKGASLAQEGLQECLWFWDLLGTAWGVGTTRTRSLWLSCPADCCGVALA